MLLNAVTIYLKFGEEPKSFLGSMKQSRSGEMKNSGTIRRSVTGTPIVSSVGIRITLWLGSESRFGKTTLCIFFGEKRSEGGSMRGNRESLVRHSPGCN